MTRSGLVQRVASKSGIAEVRAELLVETIFECMQAAMQRGERIELRGFGTFHVRNYGGYQGRNPKTGQAINVKPKRLPYFRPGAPFCVRLNRTRSSSEPRSGGFRLAPGRQEPALLDSAGANDSA